MNYKISLLPISEKKSFSLVSFNQMFIANKPSALLFGKRKLQDQHGIIAADYLFAFVIAMGLFMVLFALTFTLSITSISQYIAFSAARSFSAAHRDLEMQESLARNKFNELKNNPVFAPLFTNGWFELQIESVRSGGESGRSFSEDYNDRIDGSGERRTPSVGIRLNFVSSILNFRNPILGDAQGEDEAGFQTRITGMMNREPSAQECMNQMQRSVRYSQILKLDPRLGILAAPVQQKYFPTEDNGC